MASPREANPRSAMQPAPISPPNWISYQNTGARVVLKPGAIAEMPGEIDALGCERLFLVCGGRTRQSPVFQRVRDALGARVVGLCDEVVEHSSTRLVTDAAERARGLAVDGLVAVGGGSASDTAKAIARV